MAVLTVRNLPEETHRALRTHEPPSMAAARRPRSGRFSTEAVRPTRPGQDRFTSWQPSAPAMAALKLDLRRDPAGTEKPASNVRNDRFLIPACSPNRSSLFPTAVCSRGSTIRLRKRSAPPPSRSHELLSGMACLPDGHRKRNLAARPQKSMQALFARESSSSTKPRRSSMPGSNP